MIIKTRKNNSFTLIEVLVTIGLLIIMLTVTLAVLNPVRLRNRARDGVMQGKMTAVGETLETFFNLRDSYPSDSDDVDDLNANFFSDNVIATWVVGPPNIIEIEISGFNVGEPINFYPADECMDTPSAEDDTLFIIWCSHGAVEKGSTTDCSTSCP